MIDSLKTTLTFFFFIVYKFSIGNIFLNQVLFFGAWVAQSVECPTLDHAPGMQPTLKKGIIFSQKKERHFEISFSKNRAFHHQVIVWQVKI